MGCYLRIRIGSSGRFLSFKGSGKSFLSRSTPARAAVHNRSQIPSCRRSRAELENGRYIDPSPAESVCGVQTRSRLDDGKTQDQGQRLRHDPDFQSRIGTPREVFYGRPITSSPNPVDNPIYVGRLSSAAGSGFANQRKAIYRRCLQGSIEQFRQAGRRANPRRTRDAGL